jgi:hypothetical protein
VRAQAPTPWPPTTSPNRPLPLVPASPKKRPTDASNGVCESHALSWADGNLAFHSCQLTGSCATLAAHQRISGARGNPSYLYRLWLWLCARYFGVPALGGFGMLVCCVWEPISGVETRGRPWGWLSLMGRVGRRARMCDAGVCLSDGGEERRRVVWLAR